MVSLEMRQVVHIAPLRVGRRVLRMCKQKQVLQKSVKGKTTREALKKSVGVFFLFGSSTFLLLQVLHHLFRVLFLQTRRQTQIQTHGLKMKRLTTFLTVFVVIFAVSLNNIASSPLPPPTQGKTPPDALHLMKLFTNRLEKYNDLKQMLEYALMMVEQREQRTLDDIAVLRNESSDLEEATEENGDNENNPLRKRGKSLSVNLTLKTLQDLVELEQGRTRQNANLGYSASRLMRAGKK